MIRAIWILTCIVFASCGGVETKERTPEMDSTTATTTDQQVMYVPTGLAKLMRIIEAHGDSVRVTLEANTDLPPYPEAIDSLLTARPAEGMHIDPTTFPGFAADYQRKVNALYAAPLTERGDAYNALVQSCASCHQAHCPGPLMKINKMFVTMEGEQ